MYKRHYALCPPSFPRHYAKKKTIDGWVYKSKYTSPHGQVSIITGLNEWFDYLGDIIMDTNQDLEILEVRAKKEARRPNSMVDLKYTFYRKENQLQIPKRLNQQ